MVIEIKGNWNKGYSMGLHTISSEYLGDDQHGHPQFDTVRSDIGELVYQLKYRSNLAVIPQIIANLEQVKFSEAIDCIIPVPPSKYRRIQPVPLIANAYGKSIESAGARRRPFQTARARAERNR